MAVSSNPYAPNEDLILPRPRRRFRSGVRWQHWQLRSLIGTDGQNYVYFPVPGADKKNTQIQRLNTKTQESETVKRLSFNPRCLVARNGWVCCGGESGVFSAFRVGERSAADAPGSRSDVQADDRLPLSIDLSEATSALLAEAARSDKSLVAQSVTFVKERVNCITLWAPPTLAEAFEGAYDQDVAVLAHNDKDSTVIVASLRDQEPLDTLTYPEFVNRGVISPDGRLLIAISDDPYLYIHERKENKTENGSSVRVTDRPIYAWSPCGRIQLKGQSKDDQSDNRGSFAACFSSSGRYLAVGTQYGVISVFDVAALTMPGAQPLITSFNTSRPNAEFGAVRDMAFSPGPIDLLAWTEDRGRVGIADARAGFDARQILYLDKEDDFEHLAVTDRGTIDPRLLDQRGERSETLWSRLASALDPSGESRQNRQPEGHTSLARYNIPLTAEETAVLEAIQDYRRRQDQYGATPSRPAAESGSSSSSTGNSGGGSGPGSGSRPPWADRASRTAVEGGRNRERSASVSRDVNDILDTIRDQRIRNQHAQERLRAREDNNAERRRYAPFSGLNSAPRVAGSGASGPGALTSRLAHTPNPTYSGAWDNIEALAAYIMRDWEENPSRRVLGTLMSTQLRPGPYDTAGLSWSENGDVLFVGAENGVYEFCVNLFGRRFSPSITLS
ncbi:hypothetical protein N658DRAFT_277927 [Parathielavia hyrcaniae]|uniref:DUF2415 domain-containing protein n=1 Tax=Parathielavia hyrcaniae TaxID=113614 RepID=A0AAN6Q5Z7_9PEZI|nr:hypothetical protein N658DRAFT_277927 [Parathielavia hyrcaniae]